MDPLAVDPLAVDPLAVDPRGRIEGPRGRALGPRFCEEVIGLPPLDPP